MVKCIAVNTLCTIPSLVDQVDTVLREAFFDGNPRVRRTAVSSCTKIFKHTPGFLAEHGFVDKLYEMIRDPDPVVVTSSLLVLDSVLVAEGGVVVNHHMSTYLLSRLSDFPDPQLVSIFQVLRKYKPKNEMELFDELNVLDKFLTYHSSAVVVHCIELFLFLTEDYPALKTDIIQRSSPKLREFLASDSPEASSFVIDFLGKYSSDWLSEFKDTPELFHTKSCDPLSVVLKKLKILPSLCSDKTVKHTLQCVFHHCKNPKTSIVAINTICAIAILLPTSSQECLNTLLNLLDGDSEVRKNILNALQNFSFQNVDQSELVKLMKKVSRKIDVYHPENISPTIPLLLGNYGVLIDETPYIMELMIDHFDKFDEGFRNLLLTAVLKLFFRMPPQYQDMLGQLIEKCVTGSSIELSERALKYYYLMLKDPDLVRKLVLED